jgi:prepilin-type N-terminal cleavage/methylation domain-containing protein
MKTGMSTSRYFKIGAVGAMQGFTLFEVILVLVIISLLTAVAIARNSPVAARAKLQGQAELLKSQLRYAQARSMNANSVWGITAAGNDLSLFNDGDADNFMYLPGENTKTIVYNAGELEGLSVSDFTLSFDDRGRPCSDEAGTSLRTETLRITLSGATPPPVNIDVTPNTGFIQ